MTSNDTTYNSACKLLVVAIMHNLPTVGQLRPVVQTYMVTYITGYITVTLCRLVLQLMVLARELKSVKEMM